MAQTLTNLNINDNNAVISALREGDEEVFDHIYRFIFFRNFLMRLAFYFKMRDFIKRFVLDDSKEKSL